MEGVRLGVARHHRGRQRAEAGAAAGRDHQRGRRPGNDIGAHEDQIALLERLRGIAAALGEFLDRQRLARHGRLGDEQVLCRENPAVGRNHVARGEHHQVTRHHLSDRNLEWLRRPWRGSVSWGRAAPNDGGGVAHQRLQALGGPLRAAFLNETNQGAEPDHDADDDGGLGVRAQVRDQRQHREQQVERILVAMPQVRPPRACLLMLDVVGAGVCQARDRLPGAQPVRVRFESGDGRCGRVVRGQQQRTSERFGSRCRRAVPGERVDQRMPTEVPERAPLVQDGSEPVGQAARDCPPADGH